MKFREKNNNNNNNENNKPNNQQHSHAIIRYTLSFYCFNPLIIIQEETTKQQQQQQREDGLGINELEQILKTSSKKKRVVDGSHNCCNSYTYRFVVVVLFVNI